MKKILITGSSKGIGFALAKKLLKNNKVYGTCRNGIIDISNPNFKSFALDLTNPKSIDDFEKTIKREKINFDLIINNAGIGPDLDEELPEIETLKSTFDVNVFGTVILTEKMLDFLNPKGKILIISSKMGSLNICKLSNSVAYRMSKTAINMYAKTLSNRREGKFEVAILHPGWVKTTIAKSNINGRLTTGQSAEKIYDFLGNNFKNGIFWNVETNSECEW